MKRDIDELFARNIVLEMLMATFIIEFARHGTQDVESVRRIMGPVERELIAMHREAAPGKEEIAQKAREFFDEFSRTVLGNLPHHGPH